MVSRRAHANSAFVRNDEQVRLMTRVARMYHEHGMRQREIADELHVSQPRVARLLKKAVEAGIVRTTVVVPHSVYTDLEEELEAKFSLSQVVVVDVSGSDLEINQGLGSAAADYLSATLIGSDTVGISSWSAALLEVVKALRPFRTQVVDKVVQLVGGLGDPAVQIQATRLLERFADSTGAEPVVLSAPGVLDTASARDTMMEDSVVAEAVNTWSDLTVALVGIGALQPSELVRESGNIFAAQDRARLAQDGAVGDVCFRFYDEAGKLVNSDFNDRVIGIPPEQLLNVSRRIGVAGGSRKVNAIRGALAGDWINVLVTDVATARTLLDAC